MTRYIPALLLALVAASSTIALKAQVSQACNPTVRTNLLEALAACPDTSLEAPHVDRVVASQTAGPRPLSVTFTAELSGGAADTVTWILDTINDGQPGVTLSVTGTPLNYIFANAGRFRMYALASNASGAHTNDDTDSPFIDVADGGGGEIPVHDCGLPMNTWHPDVVMVAGVECFPGHEHGHAPPVWLSNMGVNLVYGGDEATDGENVMKHQAYKGFAFVDDRFNCNDHPEIPNCENNNEGAAHPLDPDSSDDQYGYVRVHAASNPHDRSARFHSYEVYLLSRNENGEWKISRWQGWYDTGTGIFPGLHRVTSAVDAQLRPVIGVVDQQGWDLGKRCEQWYMMASRVIVNPSDDPNEHQEYGEGWGLDLGWNICGTTTIGHPNEHLTAHDLSTWEIVPDSFGPQRRLDVSYFPGRGDPPMDVDFMATQFGVRVSGPNDPLCSGSFSIDGKTYPNKCLTQHISSSLKHIGFSTGNAWQEVFPVRGVRMPN